MGIGIQGTESIMTMKTTTSVNVSTSEKRIFATSLVAVLACVMFFLGVATNVGTLAAVGAVSGLGSAVFGFIKR